MCYGAENGGGTCPGNNVETRTCDAGPCPGTTTAAAAAAATTTTSTITSTLLGCPT